MKLPVRNRREFITNNVEVTLDDARATALERIISLSMDYQRGVGWGSDSARGEIRHWELAVLGDPVHQFKRRAQFLGFVHQLFLAQCGTCIFVPVAAPRHRGSVMVRQTRVHACFTIRGE